MRTSIRGIPGFAHHHPIVAVMWMILGVTCASGVQAGDSEKSGPREERSYGRSSLAIFEVGLPLEFEARMHGLYSRQRHAIDALAYDRWQAPGPYVRRDSLIESRISLGREIWTDIQFELAWATQTPLSLSSMPNPDRQTFGAFIRFSH